jgi:glutathione S-transferase
MLDFANYVFGPALPLKELPALQAHYEECPGRDAFRALQDEHPGLITTARPGEAEAVARIRAAIA